MAKINLHLNGSNVTGEKVFDFAQKTGGKFLLAYHTGYGRISYTSQKAFLAAHAAAVVDGFEPMNDQDHNVVCAQKREAALAKLVRLSEDELQEIATPELKAKYAACAMMDKNEFVGDVMNGRGTANCFYRMHDILAGK